MIKRLLILALLSCSPLWATTYYVDNCVVVGNDANAGTTTAAPWLTINKVNTSSFNAGDSILFEKTCTWREQLTVPSSGSAGNAITFGAYGSGALPIISGADVLTGWTPETVDVWQDTFSTTLSTYSTGAVQNGRDKFLNADLSTSGTKVRLTFKGHNTTNYTVSGCSIGPRSGTTDDMASGPTRITFDGGSSSTTVTTGTTKVSDEILYTLDETIDQLVHTFVPTGTFPIVYAAVSGGRYQITSSTTDYTMDATWTSTASSGNLYYVQKIEVLTASATAYYVPLAVTPTVVYEGTVRLAEVTAKTLLLPGTWFYDVGATRLYIRTSGNDDPAGYTIEAGARSYGIYNVSKNYTTFQDLFLTGAKSKGVNVITSTGTIVQRITVGNMGWYPIQGGTSTSYGIYLDGVTTGLVDNAEVYNVGAGIFINGNLGASDSVTIQNSTAHDIDADGITGAGGAAGSNVTNAILQHNTAYNCSRYLWDAGTGSGIHFVGTKLINGIMRYNISRNNGTAAVPVWGMGGDLSDSGYEIYGNISYGNYGPGLTVGGAGVAKKVYNNITYHNGLLSSSGQRTELYLMGTAQGADIRNNIFVADDQNILVAIVGATTGHTIDYGLYYGGSATPFRWSGTAYDFADYKTATGQDGNSLNSDPAFINAGANDFRLSSTSPAINAGTNLGSTYQLGLDNIGSFPWTLVNQSLYGNWEIGAFVRPVRVSVSQ